MKVAPQKLKDLWQAQSQPPEGWSGDQYFTASNGHKIRYAHAPAQGPERGTILLTHGYAEFIDLYYETIKDYQKMGFSVWAMDWYGFGKSGRDDMANPHNPSANGMLDLKTDLHEFATKIVQRDKTKPFIASTHSMGGNPVLSELEDHPETFDAAIMSTPMFDIYRLGLPQWTRPLFKGVFNLAARCPLLAKMPIVPTPRLLENALAKADDNAITQGVISKTLAKVFRTRSSLRRSLEYVMCGEMPDQETNNPTLGLIANSYKVNDLVTDPEKLRRIKARVLIGSAGHDYLVDTGMHGRVAQEIPGAKHIYFPTAHHGLWIDSDEVRNAWLKDVKKLVERTVTEVAATRGRENDVPLRLPVAQPFRQLDLVAA